MQRFSSYKDFDWTLLGLLGILSVFSVLEIKSATAMTKFHGFDHKQIQFLLTGLALMFIISLIDYHRLLDISNWAYAVSIVSLVAVKVVGTKVLGARRWIKAARRNPLSAVGVGEACADSGGGAFFLGSSRTRAHVGRHL